MLVDIPLFNLLLSTGLVLHELVYISSKRLAHLADSSFPVFGLRLGPHIHVMIHLALMTSAVLFSIFPNCKVITGCLFICLSLVLAAFPIRLSNHLGLAWFYILFLLAAQLSGYGYTLSSGLIQISTASVYFCSGFHKLNRAYFDPRTSCGVVLIVHYLLQKKLIRDRYPCGLHLIGIHFVVIAELLLPFFLFYPPTRALALIFCVCLHIAFGFLAHIHFSTIMFAGLVSFYPGLSFGQLASIVGDQWYLLVAVGILGGYIFGNHVPYVLRKLSVANHILFGAVATGMVALVISTDFRPAVVVQEAFSTTMIAPILFAMFGLNAAAPYLGLKQDFSFAMFSNLRPDKWCHFIMTRPLFRNHPRYVVVEDPIWPEGDSSGSYAYALLDRYFPDREENLFAIGYALDRLRFINRQCGRDSTWRLGIVASDGRTESVVFWEDPPLSWREKLSVYPYMMPRDDGIPLCH